MDSLGGVAERDEVGHGGPTLLVGSYPTLIPSLICPKE